MTRNNFAEIIQGQKTYGIVKRKDNSSTILKHLFSLYIIKSSDELTGFLDTAFLGLYDSEEELNKAIKHWNL
jgi:hypothetical protein